MVLLPISSIFASGAHPDASSMQLSRGIFPEFFRVVICYHRSHYHSWPSAGYLSTYDVYLLKLVRSESQTLQDSLNCVLYLMDYEEAR
ncbi:uncharacterized protein BO87DRAFT_106827 [Aspergillus neoniger CBS 115656]|uniref:Uncharacterized protein n=1 Tax=Aspergillus neoniger (strain CBS 115656) TaxID=1448310 RepID=A0A318YD15_ASPNB|nr:hypothetical protein BO87DRAFT_106827 [Aspergillus neoniger CBS 115656]PYH32321.1 hypothetical protein BO87DRAFT_106827 [Aspergillus neoniger CBS 115656]